MHDSLEGLRSIIGQNLMDDWDHFRGSCAVEHCKSPDQFGRGSSVDDSSNIKEVIRTVLNFLFIYFFTKRFYTHKKQKSTKKHKKH